MTELQFQKIGITVKSNLDQKDEAVTAVIKILQDLGAQIFLDEDRTADLPSCKGHDHFSSEDEVDLIVVIGGDGTILRTVRDLKSFSTPILSVNRGTIGFLAETEFVEVDKILPQLLCGEGALEERTLLDINVERKGKTEFSGFALNEAVIAQGTIARLVDLETTVNGEKLTSFHADGLIISTPTGSTAYSLAAGGPIVHPTLAATILTPINPHSFSQKPLVIASDNEVTIEVQTKANKFKDTEVVLTLDGQVYIPLKQGDLINACCCANTVKFLRRQEDTFFSTIRNKLKWGERLED